MLIGFCSKGVAASFALGLVWEALFPRRAEAYLDPGTGSLLFQNLLAALLAPLIAFKGLRERIKKLFVRRRSDSTSKPDDTPGS